MPEPTGASTGPVRRDCTRNGEVYDARYEQEGWDLPGFDDVGWRRAEIGHAPGGVLRAQMVPPIRVVETIRPVPLWQSSPGVWVFDIGESISGWAYDSSFVGYPTDCPHREKNGWTGDAHLACETGLLNFDSAAAYARWMNDFQDEQRENGEVMGVDWVQAEHRSPYDPVRSAWRRDGDRLRLEFTVPPNTKARVILPVRTVACVTEGGRPDGDMTGLERLRSTSDGVTVDIGSGRYVFDVVGQPAVDWGLHGEGR